MKHPYTNTQTKEPADPLKYFLLLTLILLLGTIIHWSIFWVQGAHEEQLDHMSTFQIGVFVGMLEATFVAYICHWIPMD